MLGLGGLCFRPEDAIPDFEAVLKLNKDIACAYVNLGLIFMTKHLNHHRYARWAVLSAGSV